MNFAKRKKVIIGLSGGVDSSVAAYLLKKQGYDVSAVFMQNWDDYVNDDKTAWKNSACSQSKDWEDAQQIAQQLDIPLRKINFVQKYWKEVFSNFLNGLKKGITPNPDVLCNSDIKFSLVNYIENNFTFDYIATGHYAKILFSTEDKKYNLSKPNDLNKDQTYFLCKINYEILDKLIFPLANLNKTEVRKIAKNLHFINAEKKDSTGICFIGERNFPKFLSNYLPNKEGNIINIANGEIIGKHLGIHYFTLGQRRGLGLKGNKEAFFVVDKKVKERAIYVARGKENTWLYSKDCIVDEVNWLVDKQEIKKYYNVKLTAKFRYRQEDVEVIIFPIKNSEKKIEVKFQHPQKAITPGQYAVFYHFDICLGGGIIIEKNKKN